MPTLVGTSVAANHAKAVETSQLGTRRQVFFVVDMNTDVETNYTASNSLYSKAVRAIQSVAEIYSVSAPNSQNFTVSVAWETAATDTPDDLNTNQNRNGVMEDAIDEACSTSCAVYNAVLNGSSLEYNC
jgi:hypothetical protein